MQKLKRNTGMLNDFICCSERNTIYSQCRKVSTKRNTDLTILHVLPWTHAAALISTASISSAVRLSACKCPSERERERERACVCVCDNEYISDGRAVNVVVPCLIKFIWWVNKCHFRPVRRPELSSRSCSLTSWWFHEKVVHLEVSHNSTALKVDRLLMWQFIGHIPTAKTETPSVSENHGEC